jgi:hypothetical protein
MVSHDWTLVKNNKYVPPSKRNGREQEKGSNSSSQPYRKSTPINTQKREPKKEFSINAVPHEFPGLSQTTTQTVKNPVNNFSKAASSQKTINNPSNENKDTENSLPGWVYININKSNDAQGMYNYKYVDIEYSKLKIMHDQSIKDDEKLGNILFNHRIIKEQNIRDIDIDRLGDLSKFYGKPTISEEYENDTLLNELNDESYYSSDGCD